VKTNWKVANVKGAIKAYARARDRLRKAADNVRKAAMPAFLEGCQRLFEANAWLKSFAWRQFTYWSEDLGEQYFVDCDAPDVNGKDGYGISDDDKVQGEVASFLSEFSLGYLLDTFGIDVCVTVRRNGTISTKDYEWVCQECLGRNA
jgi:hypothetical protein